MIPPIWDYLAEVQGIQFLSPRLSGARIALQTFQELFWRKSTLMDVSIEFERWRQRMFDLHFDVPHWDRIDHQSAETRLRLLTGGYDITIYFSRLRMSSILLLTISQSFFCEFENKQ